ncbi:fimbrial protein, partial [Escherichia coli]
QVKINNASDAYTKALTNNVAVFDFKASYVREDDSTPAPAQFQTAATA